MRNIKSISWYLEDFRSWLFFFFFLRLIGISNAPLEIGHSWRQALTNMMTRNFFQNGLDLLHPTIDMAGEKTGIIGAEFPFYNLLTYWMTLGLGYDHWYGRIINLIISSFGIYCFYLLIKAFFKERIAFSSSLVLLVSIWFGYSRKIMPDTFSVSLVLIALYFAYVYLVKGKWLHLLLYFILLTLGILCKLPAIVLMSAFVVLPFLKEITQQRKIFIYLASFFAVGISMYWYFVWVPELNHIHDYPLFFPRGIIEGWNLIIPLWKEFLAKFYADAFRSYVAFAVFLVGLFFMVKRKNNLLTIAILSITFVFLIFVLKTGIVFPTHSYYIIPFVPVMALIFGFAFEKIKRPYYGILLAIITIESIANQQHDFFIKESEKYKLTLEPILDKYAQKEDKIVINGGDSPQHIYFANRKGWTNDSQNLLQSDYLDSIQRLGAAYLVWDRHAQIPFNQTYNLLFENDDYQLYSLK